MRPPPAQFLYITRPMHGRVELVRESAGRLAPITAALFLGLTLAQTPASAGLPPVIYSVPPSEAFTMFEYNYQINASDPDGDFLTYSLIEFPEGMVLDFLTGLLSWRPALNQTGEHRVRLAVSDGTFSTLQEFTLTVARAANHPLPGLRISAPLEGQSINRTFYVRGVVSSAPGAPPVSLVEVSVDSGPWFPASLQGDAWTSPLDTSKYRNGRHFLTARAYDGHIYSPELRVNLTFDNPRYVLMDYDVHTDPGPGALAAQACAMVLAVILVMALAVWLMNRRGAGG